MTTVDEGRQAGRQSEEPDAEESDAQAGARARESVPPHPRIALTAVTKRARSAGAGAAGWATRRDSLVHARSATFHETWAQHRECAQHYQAALLRVPRYVWGVAHTILIKPLADGLQWVTFSPARTVVTIAVAAVIRFYL